MALPTPANDRLAEYDMAGIISEGSFGKVYKVVRKADGRVFALKKVNLSKMNRAQRQEAIDEARMLAQLNHPHVVKHYDSFIDADDRLNILMEYASKGSLSALIKGFRGKPMPEDTVWRILIQSLLGLHHIHSKKIIHRDIKSLNLFIDAHDNIKIGDLGIARALSNNSDFARTLVGTPYYLSPELCEDKPYNVKSDIWALGVVMYECCMGRYPFDAQNEGALIRKILRGQYQPISGPFSSTLVQIISSCLAFKPEHRPDTGMLLKNTTLRGKAQTLKIDLEARPLSVLEDKPVYETPAAPPVGQHGSPGGPPGYAAAPGGYGSPYPVGQIPGPSPHRPASDRAPPGQPYPQQQQPQYPGRSPQPAPQHHPFALPGGPANGGAPYGSPAPYGNPGAQGNMAQYGGPYGQQHPAYNSPRQGPPYGAQQQQQPSPYRDQHSPADRLAADVNKMNLRGNDGVRYNADRAQEAQDHVHRGKQDHAKDVLYGGPQDTGPKAPRVAPEVLPPAGQRHVQPTQGAPFATHIPGGAAYQSQAQATMTDAWRATYQPPQYGRRRNPELQITGPSLRGTGPAGGGGRAGYVPAADDNTSYTTSYYTGYR